MTKRTNLVIALGVALVSVMIILLIIGRPEPGPEWVQTDKEQYLIGEEVTIHFTNLSDKTIEIGDWGIDGEDVDIRVRIWDLLPPDYKPPLLEPGETFSFTWDFTERMPPGEYTVWWSPYELVKQDGNYSLKAIGPFSYEFEIIDRIRDNESWIIASKNSC